MKKLHDHDTAGDVQWNRFYHGLQTEEKDKCPIYEVIVIDHVKVNIAEVNAVKWKEKYWIEPSCGGADP
eukprot:3007792-Prorocentrum_lima.AAC.1